MTKLMKGVLDRIEDNQAVILIEAIDEQFNIPVSDLPSGSKAGTYYDVEKSDGRFIIKGINKQTTVETAKKSADLQTQLKAKSKRSNYKRK